MKASPALNRVTYINEDLLGIHRIRLVEELNGINRFDYMLYRDELQKSPLPRD